MWARASIGALRTALAWTVHNPLADGVPGAPVADTTRACFAALTAAPGQTPPLVPEGMAASGVPPGLGSMRRCAGSRNRPLASLAPGGQRSFPGPRAVAQVARLLTVA